MHVLLMVSLGSLDFVQGFFFFFSLQLFYFIFECCGVVWPSIGSSGKDDRSAMVWRSFDFHIIAVSMHNNDHLSNSFQVRFTIVGEHQ
jgi:hypothetical protein